MAGSRGCNVHVLGGSGALGLLVSAHLARAGNRVTLLLRDEALAVFRAREGADGGGLISVETRGRAGEATTTAAVRAEPARATAAATAATGGLIENLIVATKAPDAGQALRDLAPRLSPERSVGLLLCNGALALRDELLRGRTGGGGGDRAPPPPPPPPPLARLLVASVSHGAYRAPGDASAPPSFSAVHAGMGEFVMGDLGGLEEEEDDDDEALTGGSGGGGGGGGGGGSDPRSQPMPELARAMEAAGPMLAARWEPDRRALRRALLSKLTVNCAANAAAGLLRCRNGGMLPGSNAAAAELQGRVVDECVSALALARAFGFLRGEGGGGRAAEAEADVAVGRALRRTVDEALTRTRGNVNSLLQDLLAGRRTEVDYLNGWVAREAARRRPPGGGGGGGGGRDGGAWGSAPLNEALALLVRAAEGVPAGEGVHGRREAEG